MKLKTYQAYTMAEALLAVKRDLGDAAVILNTRSFQRGGFLGLGRKTIVQVTAGIPVPATGTSPSRATKPAGGPAINRDGRASTAQRAYRTAATQRNAEHAASSPSSRAASSSDTVTVDDQRRTRRLAQAMMAKLERGAEAGSASSSSQPIESDPPRGASPKQPAQAAPRQDQAATSRAARSTSQSADCRPPEPSAAPRVAQRFVLAPAPAAHRSTASQPVDGPNDGPAHQSADEPETRSHPVASPHMSMASTAVQDELAAIKQMVSQVLHRKIEPSRAGTTAASGSAADAGMPAELFDLYLKLISQDVSEELADEIVSEVRDELDSEELKDASVVRAAVLRHLARLIPVADAPLSPGSPDGRPLTIALIGPTGVGKTTTLAKLAASFKLRHGKRVGLITSDTYRIAAVDQLRTYANIIGLPLQVVLTPAEMRQAVHALRDCDVILIDTAGRGQNDTGRLEELSQFLAAGNPHEVHLVLSSTASEKVLLREAEAFSRVGVHKVVLTKLDEAVSFGMVLSVIRSIGKQLSFVTTGQEVPDHIEVGRADRLAELILGLGEIRPDLRRDGEEATGQVDDRVGESWGRGADESVEEDARPETCAT